MTKYTFEKVVKHQIRSQAFKYLLDLKGTHTKMNMLDYEKLKLQPYLEIDDISPLQAIDIFRFRTNMLEDFTDNFRGSKGKRMCISCKSHVDNQYEIGNCFLFKDKIYLVYGANPSRQIAEIISAVIDIKKIH